MKKGFTLAETLIALGIIGIVAALTVPNIINHYNKKTYVTGLQRGYAMLNQVFKTAMATEQVEEITQTTMWEKLPEDNSISQAIGNHDEFVAELSKYMRITNFCTPIPNGAEHPCFNVKYKLLYGGYSNMEGELTIGNRLKIYTNDGITYYLRLSHNNNISNDTNFVGNIEIDINGDNKPNQYGKDLFSLILHKDGHLVAPGTKYWKENVGGSHWSLNENASSCLTEGSTDFYGDYCAARIFESGWKMDY